MTSLSKQLQEKNRQLDQQHRKTADEFLKLMKVDKAIEEIVTEIGKAINELNFPVTDYRLSTLVHVWPLDTGIELYQFKEQNYLCPDYIAKNIEAQLSLENKGNFDIKVILKEDHGKGELKVYLDAYLNVLDF